MRNATHLLAVVALLISFINGVYIAVPYIYGSEKEESKNNFSSIKNETTTVKDDSDSILLRNETTISDKNTNNNPLFLEFNSSHYTWVGDHFIPPQGVPTFSPSDFASYFKGRNTLFIGDSTTRRAYATLFAIMNSTDQSDIQVSDLVHPDVIDFNKGRKSREEPCLIPGRTLMNNNSALLDKPLNMVCRNIFVSNPASSSSTQESNQTNITYFHNDTSAAATADINNSSRPAENSSVMNSSNGTHSGTTSSSNSGKFDFARINTLAGLSPFVLNQTQANTIMTGAESLKDYDLVIIGLGIWEFSRPADCIMKNEAGEIISIEDKFHLILDGLVNLSSPDLQIVYRTPGYSTDEKATSIMDAFRDRAMNHPARQRDATGVPREIRAETVIKGGATVGIDTSNFTVVDWGSVILKRSHGARRIRGDSQEHYGLEGRLLFAQQLLHELLASSSSSN